MSNTGTPGFQRFAQNLRRVRSMETELAQENAVRREEFRASLVAQPDQSKTNLLSVFAYFRGRVAGR